MLDRNKFLGAMVTAGFTQQELAKVIKMSKNTLSAKLNGKSHFDTAQIDEICMALGIDDDSTKVQIFLSKASQKRDALWKESKPA